MMLSNPRDAGIALLVLRHLYDGDAVDYPVPDTLPQSTIFKALEAEGLIARWSRIWPMHDRYRLTEKGIAAIEAVYRPATAEATFKQLCARNLAPQARPQALRALGADPAVWPMLHDPHTHWMTWPETPGPWQAYVWEPPPAAPPAPRAPAGPRPRPAPKAGGPRPGGPRPGGPRPGGPRPGGPRPGPRPGGGVSGGSRPVVVHHHHHHHQVIDHHDHVHGDDSSGVGDIGGGSSEPIGAGDIDAGYYEGGGGESGGGGSSGSYDEGAVPDGSSYDPGDAGPVDTVDLDAGGTSSDWGDVSGGDVS